MKKSKNTSLQTNADYNVKLHRIGRAWTSIGVLLLISIPVVISLFYDATVKWEAFAGCVVLLLINFGSGVSEPIIYASMLGTSGEYLAFMTGNLSNMKIPCVVKAQEIVGSKIGTEENELVSTVSIAVSSLVTVLVVAVMVMCLAVSPLQTAIEQNPFLNNAFGCVVYALFGALGGKYLVKNFRLAAGPAFIMVVLAVVLTRFAGMSLGSAWLMVGIVLMAIWAFAPIVKDSVQAKKEKKVYDNISNGVDLEETYALIFAQNAKKEQKEAKRNARKNK